MIRVFLSYCHKDVDAARRLYEGLNSYPAVDVWFDKESLKPGQHWEHEIRKAIRESRYVLLLLSQASIERRGFFYREMRLALDVLDEYPNDDIYLLPARLDQCEPSLERLKSIHWVDLFPDWHTGVGRLVDAMQLHTRSTTSTASADTAVRVTTHQARFQLNERMYYFINITNLSEKPIEVTHVWYEDSLNHIAARQLSRPLPVRLIASESWSTWLALDMIPKHYRSNAYHMFRVRLSTGTVYASVKEATIPPFGTVSGGPIERSDIE